jgi:hypothetical protein
MYTVVPGKLGDYMKAHKEIGRPIRGDNYGKLEGGWTTEIGPLNRYVHLWSYENLEERARLRAELQKNEGWTKEYGPLIRQFILKQQNKILYAQLPFTPPAAGKHVYELRTYQHHLGRTPEWVNNFKEALPARSKYSTPVCLWTTDIGETLNQVVHLWAYDDLNHRASVRAATQGDPEWQAFLAKSQSLMVDMQSMVMLPTATSPLQ